MRWKLSESTVPSKDYISPSAASFAAIPGVEAVMIRYLEFKRLLKQISDKSDARKNGKKKSTESEERPARGRIQLFFHIHPDSNIDEARNGDEEEEMRRNENTETGICRHQGYSYIYKEVRQNFTIIVSHTVSCHA